MKVFLSLGMSGREEKDVLNDIEEATTYIHSLFPDYEIVHTYFQEEAPKDAGLTYYLGKSIQVLGGCDQVWFINDWENYRGCRIEHEICELYGIPYSYLDLRPDIADPSEIDQIKIKSEAEAESDHSERCLASDLFDIYGATIIKARNFIGETRDIISEFKDGYSYPDDRIKRAFGCAENALDMGVNTINQLINIIKSERE